jgi:hypothetical protein
MAESHSDPAWNGLALVGMYLLRWGKLETALSIGFALLAEDDEIGPEIEPDSISRTLSHLLTKWKVACKKYNPKERGEIEALANEISDASVHRNTICHGFQEIKAGGDDPRDFTISCYHKFHHVVMTSMAIPDTTTFDRTLLVDLIVKVREFSLRVKQLSDVAIAKRESSPTPKAK